MRTTAALLVVLGLLLAGASLVRADEPMASPRGADACARAKSEFQRAHPEVFAPSGTVGAIAATPGTENYDVSYYDLNLYCQTTGLPRRITGTLTMRAKVLPATLTQVPMDLRSGMAITAVTAGGVATTFTRSGNVITVNLNRTYLQNEIFEIKIDYNGTATGSIHMDLYLGSILIWSLSEPYGARTWWPCKDWSEDKADSMDIHLNVPDTHIAASQGRLVSVTVPSAGRKQYNWHESYPISTYLVSIAAYPYTVYSEWYHYSPTDSMEVRMHVFPADYPACVPNFALTVPMIEAYAALFGEYPFVEEKYGHAAFDWGGAMEHQTCTSITGYDEYIIAHELTHQWFGDLITCDTFNHIWLNEGFATYGEALWGFEQSGQSGYDAQMGGAAYYGPGTVYVENPQTEDVFDSNLSYNKASWVVHMLRHVVGDSVFFDLMHEYTSNPGTAYATATTEEFRDICEAVSGKDLDQYFQQWVYGEYYPIYDYSWSAAPAAAASGYDVSLSIDQSQTWQLFNMPIDVTVSFASGETTLVVQDSLAHQDFTLHVAEAPTRVQIDKDNWILRIVNEPMPTPTFDRGILVVNGVDWDTYSTEIRSAYQDSVFWGNHAFSFWDCFPTPGGGYPSNLPAPLGHGTVPPDTLKQFSTIVWVGNNYNGDVVKWNNTPIKSYLEAGGNVLLLSRMGQDFITPPLQGYLGLTWRESPQEQLGNCTSTYPGLVDMAFTGSGQSLCAVFDTTFTQMETRLLFRDTSQVRRGTGAWRKPTAGGQYRPGGGQFVFVSGRPYRMSHTPLRANVQYILDNLFHEPYNPASSVAGGTVVRWSLDDARPNPFNPKTTIRFNVAHEADVTLRVFDVAGRTVATLVHGPVAAGPHTVTWDGRGANGERAASGVYFYRLEAPGFVDTRKMVMMK